ncbi:MAG: peptidylprolyl isomerase [Phycisphaeraceae bacterium]|nr:peptidylprolyl isomerase [Phycisphaeraceae bacterium]
MRGIHTLIRGAAILIAAVLQACAGGSSTPARSTTQPDVVVAVLETSKGEITVTLDRGRAPITVANFLSYAGRGDYDGTVIHRVVPGFVIQGGGWTPDLQERAKATAATGRPDAPIKNEWPNGLTNTRGALAMARDEQPDTATREFYINLADNGRLDTARATTGNAGYAVFGRVIDGMDVVDAIAAAPTEPRPETGVTDGSMNNVPIEPVVLVRVVVLPAR